MTDYLDELNESQRAAVLYNEGPSLVIAGLRCFIMKDHRWL